MSTLWLNRKFVAKNALEKWVLETLSQQGPSGTYLRCLPCLPPCSPLLSLPLSSLMPVPEKQKSQENYVLVLLFWVIPSLQWPINQVCSKWKQDCCGHRASHRDPTPHWTTGAPEAPELLLPEWFLTWQSSSMKATMTRSKRLSYIMDSI